MDYCVILSPLFFMAGFFMEPAITELILCMRVVIKMKNRRF